MSDIDSGAPAPAEPSGVPISNPAPQTAPLGSQTPVAEKTPEAPKPDVKPEPKPEDDKPSKSAGEALKKAFAAIEAKKGEDAKPVAKEQVKDAVAKTDAKAAEVKPEQPRENGKFALSEPKPDTKPSDVKPADTTWLKPHERAHYDAMSPDQKAIIDRRHNESNQGIEKYKAEVETLRRESEPITPFKEMAKQAGTTVHEALKQYTDLDKLLHTDKLKGLEAIFDRIGVSPRDYAAHILNQTPDQQASQSDATIRELRQQNATLEQRLNRIEQGEQQRTAKTTEESVAAFAADNPRFDELAEAIVQELKHGYSLPEAYERAERLNPAAPSIKIPVASATTKTDPEGQILKGSKSLSGAPASGSDPATRPTAKTPREALERAFARFSV